MKLNKKRRIENKTNYKRRLILLKSTCPRLVVRKTNKYLTAQVIESESAQDKVIFSVSTKELLKHGWPENKSNSLKSITAGYLAGLLLGKQLKGVKKLILDIGLSPSTKGSRIYAFVKGVSDAKIEINCSKEMFPSEDRIKGEHIELDKFEKIKEKIENGK